MKNIPENIEELIIEDNGNLILNGKAVDAIPIGKPFHMEMNGDVDGPWNPYTVWKKTKQCLKRDYTIPDEANAIVFGDSANHFAYDLDMRIVPVQPYKIRK